MKTIIKEASIILLVALVGAFLAVLCGCSRRIYPTAQHRTTDTIYRVRTDSIVSRDTIIQVRTMEVADTILVRDSIVIIKTEQGEVKHIYSFRNKERIRATQTAALERVASTKATNHTDTIYRVRTEYKEKPIVVNRPLRWYERIALWVGIITLIILSCYAIVRFIARPVKL